MLTAVVPNKDQFENDFFSSSNVGRNSGNVTPFELDPPPSRLGHTKDSSTFEPVKRQYSRFEVVKAPDVFESGSSVEIETQRSHNLQQLQLMTLLPSSEPQTPVPMQSCETDEVSSER